MALAAKIPYDHPFAGGYPGIGSQPLPTDSDCLTYLSAVAAADGAGVEVGVAVAVDEFFRATKASGVFSALKACCILAGARTLAGALVPLRGDAPTAYGFVDGDYDREGLTGDGTSYLDSNRSATADGQNARHWAVYSTASLTNGDSCFGLSSPAVFFSEQYRNGASNFLWCGSSIGSGADAATFSNSGAAGFHGASRASASGFDARSAGGDITATVASATPLEGTYFVFARNRVGTGAELVSATTLAFYSIGSSLDLAKLDSHVSDYVTAIGAAI